MTTRPAILDHLDHVQVESDKQWTALCPAHPDRKPSLSVGVGDDGRVLVHCQAGCPIDAVLEALQMTRADLFPEASAPSPNGPRRIVETYDYCGTFGVLLFQVVRYEPKQFMQRRPDGDGGWIWNVKGVEKVLYKLQPLTRAPDDAMIYIVEGEKDVDRLYAEGMIATCSSGGAGKWKHTDDTPLHGRPVAIVSDNDPQGHDHTLDVASRLHGKAKSVRIVELPGLPDKGDVSDWLDLGHDVEDLDRLASSAPLWEPSTAIVKVEAETALEPYRDGRESRAAVEAMKATGQAIKEQKNVLAMQIAGWLDRQGPQMLDRRGPQGRFVKVDHPYKYAAAWIGISVAYLHRLGQQGRVLRCLPLVDSGVSASERSLRPLTRLLASHPEEIPKAYQDAQEQAEIDARESNERVKPVRPKHTAAAVDAIIGPAPEHTPVKRKVPANARSLEIDGVRRRIEELAAHTAAILGDDIPADIRTRIVALAEQDWCRP